MIQLSSNMYSTDIYFGGLTFGEKGSCDNIRSSLKLPVYSVFNSKCKQGQLCHDKQDITSYPVLVSDLYGGSDDDNLPFR